MSIVPSPGQMGPGSGSISGALIRHPTLFKGLGMGPALSGLGVGIYLADLNRSRQEGFGSDVQAYRAAVADRVAAQIASTFSTLVMSAHNEQTLDLSSSSGGGGPGGLPNLHQPPPSIEEAGEIISNPPVVVDSKPSRKVSRGKKPKRCPKGKRWSRRLRRCVDAKLFPPGFVTVRALANEWQ
jgi:hypothetical protein